MMESKPHCRCKHCDQDIRVEPASLKLAKHAPIERSRFGPSKRLRGKVCDGTGQDVALELIERGRDEVDRAKLEIDDIERTLARRKEELKEAIAAADKLEAKAKRLAVVEVPPPRSAEEFERRRAEHHRSIISGHLVLRIAPPSKPPSGDQS